MQLILQRPPQRTRENPAIAIGRGIWLMHIDRWKLLDSVGKKSLQRCRSRCDKKNWVLLFEMIAATNLKVRELDGVLLKRQYQRLSETIDDKVEHRTPGFENNKVIIKLENANAKKRFMWGAVYPRNVLCGVSYILKVQLMPVPTKLREGLPIVLNTAHLKRCYTRPSCDRQKVHRFVLGTLPRG